MCAKCVWPPLCVYTHVRVDWKSIKTSRTGRCLGTAMWVMGTECRPLQGCCSSPMNLS